MSKQNHRIVCITIMLLLYTMSIYTLFTMTNETSFILIGMSIVIGVFGSLMAVGFFFSYVDYCFSETGDRSYLNWLNKDSND